MMEFASPDAFLGNCNSPSRAAVNSRNIGILLKFSNSIFKTVGFNAPMLSTHVPIGLTLPGHKRRVRGPGRVRYHKWRRWVVTGS